MMGKSVENKTNETQESAPGQEAEFDEKFKPKGAVAFFAVLLLICAAIWYGVYYLQAMRQ